MKAPSKNFTANRACRTRCLSVITLARPSVSSSLQVTNRSFTYASPYLWNQLPSSFRQLFTLLPVHLTLCTSQSPLLSPSITPSTFHPRLKTHLLHSPLLHSLYGSLSQTEVSINQSRNF